MTKEDVSRVLLEILTPELQVEALAAFFNAQKDEATLCAMHSIRAEQMHRATQLAAKAEAYGEMLEIMTRRAKGVKPAKQQV